MEQLMASHDEIYTLKVWAGHLGKKLCAFIRIFPLLAALKSLLMAMQKRHVH
jgi:hypothetical protein